MLLHQIFLYTNVSLKRYDQCMCSDVMWRIMIRLSMMTRLLSIITHGGILQVKLVYRDSPAIQNAMYFSDLLHLSKRNIKQLNTFNAFNWECYEDRSA